MSDININTEVNFMTVTAKRIFNRVYQSYLTGGDTYTYFYKTTSENEILQINSAIDELKENGLVDIIHQNDKKARMCITPEGITFGNNNIEYM